MKMKDMAIDMANAKRARLAALKQKQVKRARKERTVINKGAYSEAGEWFPNLKALKLRAHPECVKVVPLDLRPYLSKLAKQMDDPAFHYLTINVGDGNMIVLRYSLKK